MEPNQQPADRQQPSFIPAGWKGGFSENPPGQPYPNAALLNSLSFEKNMDNIQNLTRMLRAKWPEFSWETKIGDPTTRMYQMFAPDISRLGYDNTGRVWSIICPQQGVYLPSVGITMNIEVTVTGNRGWINELAKYEELFAADIKIKPTIWLSTDPDSGLLWSQLLKLNAKWGDKLPLSKLKGIRVSATNGDGTDAIQVRMGERPNYPYPKRANHWNEFAWAVANLAVKIGVIDKGPDPNVNEFNRRIMELFNIGSGNLLLENNTLTWNLWAGSPELVNQEEWRAHATYWRDSIDVNHRPPVGEGTGITDINGKPFDPSQVDLAEKVVEFGFWLVKQLVIS